MCVSRISVEVSLALNTFYKFGWWLQQRKIVQRNNCEQCFQTPSSKISWIYRTVNRTGIYSFSRLVDPGRAGELYYSSISRTNRSGEMRPPTDLILLGRCQISLPVLNDSVRNQTMCWISHGKVRTGAYDIPPSYIPFRHPLGSQLSWGSDANSIYFTDIWISTHGIYDNLDLMGRGHYVHPT